MFQVSPKAKKISLISVFSLMLAVIVGLSVALGIVCNKDKEQWDVVTDEYAYKIIYNTYNDYKNLNVTVEIQLFSPRLMKGVRFDIQAVNSRNKKFIAYPTSSNCGMNSEGKYEILIPYSHASADFLFYDHPKYTFKYTQINIIDLQLIS